MKVITNTILTMRDTVRVGLVAKLNIYYLHIRIPTKKSKGVISLCAEDNKEF